MTSDAPIVVLAGGTGGAKLARGMLDADDGRLVVIANPGDDTVQHGGYVSPDPDLVTFWLADRIDDRGWGLRDDTFHVMDGLRELGDDVWFNLGDRDLALCLHRARRLADGDRPTAIAVDVARALGVPDRARVLPAADDPVRTMVRADGRWWPFQEFMIRGGGRDDALPVEGVRFDGADDATVPPEALDAIASARAVVIGPSNPVISIGPMLAIPALRDALRATPAPVVAVAPFVGGEVVKGPTRSFLAWAGASADAAGVASLYRDVRLDGMVTDEPATLDVPVHVTSTDLGVASTREAVAREVLRFCGTVSAPPARSTP
ncbi:MAG: 2-phospho-L-lactate transferase CofD family protein [Solirubrobacteraceae bacterium]|nr:2-phospho-L-lactate transferase CofD family protein [Solirubrobacteraceae bacterium]